MKVLIHQIININLVNTSTNKILIVPLKQKESTLWGTSSQDIYQG